MHLRMLQYWFSLLLPARTDPNAGCEADVRPEVKVRCEKIAMQPQRIVCIESTTSDKRRTRDHLDGVKIFRCSRLRTRLQWMETETGRRTAADWRVDRSEHRETTHSKHDNFLTSGRFVEHTDHYRQYPSWVIEKMNVHFRNSVFHSQSGQLWENRSLSPRCLKHIVFVCLNFQRNLPPCHSGFQMVDPNHCQHRCCSLSYQEIIIFAPGQERTI
jgi:hypothetical protein